MIDRPMRQSHLLSAAVCALGLAIIAVVFRDVLTFYFLSDAWGEMRYVRFHNPLRFFTHDTYNSFGGRHYRPMWRISGWVQHKLSGDALFDPRVLFTFQLGWHLVIAAQVFVITQLLRAPRAVAFLAMLLFGLHPAVVEAVAWTAAESFLLAGVFSAAAMVTFLLADRLAVKRTRWGVKALSLAFAWMAMTSNETGLGIVPMLVLLAWHLDARKAPAEFLRARWPFLAGCAALLLVYFAIRFILFGAISNWYPEPSSPGVARRHELADYCKTIPAVLAWQAWPSWLDNKIAVLDPLLYLMMGAAIATVVGWLAVVRKEGWATFALGIIAFSAAQIPSQRIYLMGDDPFAGGYYGGRIYYLSIMSGAIAAGFILRAASESGRNWRRVAFAATALVICQNAASTAVNLRVYQYASDIVRRFAETLPAAVPQPAPADGVAFVGLPLTSQIRPVEGMLTAEASMFWVGTEFLAEFILRERDEATTFSVYHDPALVPPGMLKITIASDGSAVVME